MKQIHRTFLICTLIISQVTKAQTNTFPSTGNAGVGTTTPEAKLDVFADGSTLSNMLRVGNGTGRGLYLGALASSSVSAVIDFRNGNVGTRYLDFRGEGVSRMVLTAAGSLGIGTTTPLEKLHVNSGKMYIQSVPLGVGVSSGAILRLGTHNYSDWSAGLGITQGAGVDVFDLDFYTIYGTASQKMKLTAGGYLGIGTTSPTNKLQVGTNPANYSGQDALISNANGSIALYNASGYSYISANQSLVLQSLGGNVGINTSAPNQKLTIKGGGIGFDGNSADKKLYSPVDGLLEWVTNNSAIDHGFAVSHQGIKKVYFNTNGTSYLMGGSLGVGTANPGAYTLAVEGTIGARKIKVTTNSWADYVFEPTYHLPTLQEVEAFIKTNKHLPGVPSAAEVEKAGLDVGDNQVTLLKKIEELTLYIIEMKKEIDALKAQNK